MFGIDYHTIENIGRYLMRLYSIPSGLHHKVPKGRHALGLDANPALDILLDDVTFISAGLCPTFMNTIHSGLHHIVLKGRHALGFDANPALNILLDDGYLTRFDIIKKALKGRNRL